MDEMRISLFTGWVFTGLAYYMVIAACFQTCSWVVWGTKWIFHHV